MPSPTPPSRFHPDQVTITDDGRVEVQLTAEQVLAYVDPLALELAHERAKSDALGVYAMSLAGKATPAPGPSDEAVAAAYLEASKAALAEALEEAGVQFPKGATKKALALLCAQHHVSV